MNCAIRTGEILSHIRDHNLRPIADSGGPVFVICDRYNGVWMEHLLDGVVWAELSGDGALAVCQLDLFFRHQKADGSCPLRCWITASATGRSRSVFPSAACVWMPCGCARMKKSWPIGTAA